MSAVALEGRVILESPAPSFEPECAETMAREYFGIDGRAEPLGSERDQNFSILSSSGARFVLKISNPAEDPRAVEFENAALQHVAAVSPAVPVPRLRPTLSGSSVARHRDDDGKLYLVRLITWLAGVPLRQVKVSGALRRQLAVTLADLGRSLRGFFHPAAAKPLLWDMQQVADLAGLLPHIGDEALRESCAGFVSHFGREIRPALARLRSQVIYNDLNPSNVLVSVGPAQRVTGIVDFGDMVHGPLVCDVAVGAAYQLGGGEDPLAGAAEFVAAYHREVPLEPEELELLPDLIAARLVMTVAITSWRAARHPGNREYILRNAAAAADGLRRLAELGPDGARDRLLAACPPVPIAPAPPASAPEDTGALVRRRDALLGPAYRLFYRNPLHAVRGEGVWLYDADGRAYLDAYNNVPLVGHSHPQVVAALAAQAATLNTHTRYLHRAVLDYAERLLSKFPASLDRVMFGCTGTEANDLALRIARATTGHCGVIATAWAYHGNSATVAQVSPSYASGEAREDWVELIPAPDTYRRPTGMDDAALCAHWLAELDAAIDRLTVRGIRPAALILDAGFTSDGMFLPPPGLLQGAADRIRDAGGLYIADEVQSGFGRFGKSLWGFELHGVEPDVVTLGKPIGNGHPLSATVIRSTLLDRFAEGTRYFNTFAGNPVSVAVGLAVLDVFEREDLLENSRSVGAYLHEQLRSTAADFDVIGDVRGLGLFAGVELVKDSRGREWATGLAAEVVNGMRERGVLISMIGPQTNVLKIRPPLPFGREHVDQLIATLRDSLQAAVS